MLAQHITNLFRPIPSLIRATRSVAYSGVSRGFSGSGDISDLVAADISQRFADEQIDGFHH